MEITGNSIKGKNLLGKVTSIAPGIKNISGKKQAYVEIRIIPEEYIPNLRTGFSVNLVINCESRENVKAVKFEAINTGIEGNKYVNLIEKDSTTKKVPIKIGLEGDVYIKIISDEIKVGDRLLINDDFKNVQSEDEIMF